MPRMPKLKDETSEIRNRNVPKLQIQYYILNNIKTGHLKLNGLTGKRDNRLTTLVQVKKRVTCLVISPNLEMKTR